MGGWIADGPVSRTVSFRWTFPYRASPAGAPAPLVPVRLGIGGYVVDLLLLVDTGAQASLLDGIHVRAAGLDIFSGPPRPFFGFLGASTTAHAHRVRLQVGSVELERSVHFTPQPMMRSVLGRDLLADFRLGLRELHQELLLGPEF